MKKIAVIVAGGSGLRMNSFVPKQFLLLKGKPLLFYTLRAFLNAYTDMQVILVLPEEYISRGEELVASFAENERIKIVKGGATRFHSVQNGLKLIIEPAVVAVHDGVRCLISKELIVRCVEQALEKGSAIPAVQATDSIRLVEGELNKVADRDIVRIIQTPQTFKSDILLTAFKQEHSASFTDEATVVEAAGHPVFLCEGEYDNIKITRPVDLLIAESILQEKVVV